MLFSLPVDLAVAVLRDFLATHEDLSKLDMACAPSVRTDFLAILSSSSFLLTVSRPCYADDNLQWLASRRIKAQHVRFNYRSQAALLLEMDLTRLEVLDTDAICLKKSMAHLILDRCPVLRSVVCREAGFLGYLPQHPTLPLREIACFSSGRVSSHVLHKLIAAFPNVEVLSLPEYLLKSADVAVMASGWTHLKSITFQQGHATPEEVATFLASFRFLETVAITVDMSELREGGHGGDENDEDGEGDEDAGVVLVEDIVDWTDEDTANLVARIPRIKSIKIIPLYSSTDLTYLSFLHILKNCPQVTYVELPFIIYRKNQQQTTTCSVTFPRYENEEVDYSLLTTTCLLGCQVPISEVKCMGRIDEGFLNAIGDYAGPSLTSFLISDVEDVDFNAPIKQFLHRCPNLRTLVVNGTNGPGFMNTLCTELAVCGHAIRKISFLKEFFMSKGLKEFLKVRGAQLTHFIISGSTVSECESWVNVVVACINLEELQLLDMKQSWKPKSCISQRNIMRKIIRPNLLKHLRKFVVKDNIHAGLLAACKQKKVDPRWGHLLKTPFVKTKAHNKDMIPIKQAMVGPGRGRWMPSKWRD